MSDDPAEIERILAQLAPADRAMIAELVLPPWRRRALRLAERGAAIRDLASLRCFACLCSGRAMAQAIAKALARYAASAWRFERDSAAPADRERALLHRILTLSGSRAIGAVQARRILAGVGGSSLRAEMSHVAGYSAGSERPDSSEVTVGVVATLKRIVSSEIDDQAKIAAAIAAFKSEASEASVEIDRAMAERLVAEDYDAALACDERIKRAQWFVDRAAAKLPELEARLAAATADRQREALARRQAEARVLYPRLRMAVEEAARIQVEAMQARQAALAELGEHVVSTNIPVIAFRGLILPDLVKLWSDEMDRVFAAPLPKLQSSPRAAPPAAMPSKTTAAAAAPASPQARPRRKPRHDPAPADQTERMVTIVRNGVELRDGSQLAIGDRVTLAAANAAQLVERGAADYATEPPARV